MSYDELENLNENTYGEGHEYVGLLVSPANKAMGINQQLSRKMASEITDSINNNKPIILEMDYNLNDKVAD